MAPPTPHFRANIDMLTICLFGDVTCLDSGKRESSHGMTAARAGRSTSAQMAPKLTKHQSILITKVPLHATEVGIHDHGGSESVVRITEFTGNDCRSRPWMVLQTKECCQF